MTTIIIVGMKMEEKIAKKIGCPIIIAGITKELLVQKMEEAIVTNTVTSFLSFGVAGGLSYDLKSGDIVIGTYALDCNNNKINSCNILTNNIINSLKDIKYTLGGIFGSLHPLNIDEKNYKLESIACAVDMETLTMAQIAQKHNIPFAIIRTISDSVDVKLPHAAIVAINQNGSINYAAMIKSLLIDITQIKDLIILAISSRKAFNSLKIIANILKI